MPCAIPPLDMRYSRVVARNGIGIDLVAFGADRRPATAPAVACLPGRVRRFSLVNYHYRNNLVLEIEGGLFVCYSGLAFSGRASDGATVQRGAVLGTLEEASRVAFLRNQDRTVAVDAYTTPYLYVEVYRRLPPRFERGAGMTGTTYTISSFDVVPPTEFWGSLGIDFVGNARSEIMAIRRGGPSDCEGA